MPAEAIVVGAGPAGAATAFHLARRGRRALLLDRAAFPRDKSCGDGLTRPAVEALDEMGVLDELADAQRIRGVRVLAGGRGQRDFDYPKGVTGMVVPRRRLDATLVRSAVAAGAELVEEVRVGELLVDARTVRGVRATIGGQPRELLAPVVVIANGSGSRLLERAGLLPRSEVGLGIAIRAYYDGVGDVEELLEIHAPLTDATERELLPSYGWVFPTGGGSANIGVGAFEREPRGNVRELLERMLARLAASGDRLDGAVPRGTWKGAPLRFDFASGRCSGSGFVAVGDAAGMVSPFTGEGISYALESGKLAAEVIDRNLRPAARTCPALEDYSLLVEDRYAGYFEAGRRSARRYRLAWRVLESTFESERPLFHVLRRAALFPEGIGELYASRVLDDVSGLVSRGGLRVREDLLAVGEILNDTVRRDWPFLVRLAALGKGDPGIPFRPALLMLLAAAFGNPRAAGIVEVGAAVELGYLAALAEVSIEDDPTTAWGAEGGSRLADWGNRLAVMVGDFLLARANEFASAAGHKVVGMVTAALERTCEGRSRELQESFNLDLSVRDHLTTVERKTATLFELPCQLGAHLAGTPADQAAALSAYGRQLGVAYQLADDVEAINGGGGALGRGSPADLQRGLYSLPVLTTARGPTGPQLRELLCANGDPDPAATTAARDLVTQGRAIEQTAILATQHAARARGALRPLPPGAARTTLSRLAAYAANRSTAP